MVVVGEPPFAKGHVDGRHPLAPLSGAEITQAAALVRKALQDQEDPRRATLRFKNISLHEPPKRILLPYLDAERAGRAAAARPYVPRCAAVVWTAENETILCETIVGLDAGSDAAAETMTVPRGKGYASMDRDEIRALQKLVLADVAVQAEIRKLGLHDDVVIQADCWPYGADRDSTADTPKYSQVFLYARGPSNHPDSNHYALPLPISPVVDVFQQKVVRVLPLATGGTSDGLAYNTAPPGAAMAHCVANEYHPDLFTARRRDLKPLHVVQPQGPSFAVRDENCVTWQKWRFRVGFNYREGMTIHDVTYDGRPLFYRLSMSEMTVPYGDPRSPFHRKQAFDFGDAGAGSTANSLQLGCDCLGVIHYFGGWLNDEHGAPIEAPNVICMHEQDAGIGWKHTNHRTNVAVVTRRRSLVVQTVITVGNYEYLFAWLFQQDASLEFETRATGILSTSLIDAGKTSDWGNVVGPGVLAANHQHLFCLRIDPMLDGPHNTVLQEDSLPVPPSEAENPHGNAWRLVRTVFETAGAADAAPHHNRVFKMVNEAHRNAVSGRPVGYKLVPLPSQLLLAAPDTVVRRRARYAEHHVWVTRYRDGDLWAGGRWTNQSIDETDGLADYAARREPTRNQDVVVWHTFGLTHNPRVEDFPVMPVEIATVVLQPADFFDRNPALDVPPSAQALNQSVLAAAPTAEDGDAEHCGACARNTRSPACTP